MVFESLNADDKMRVIAKDIRAVHDDIADIKSSLQGNPKIGIKPPIERLFDSQKEIKDEMKAEFDSLPCKEHGDQIMAILTKQAVNNGIRNEYAKRTLMKDVVDEFKDLPIWAKLVVIIFAMIFIILFGGGGASLFI